MNLPDDTPNYTNLRNLTPSSARGDYLTGILDLNGMITLAKRKPNQTGYFQELLRAYADLNGGKIMLKFSEKYPGVTDDRQQIITPELDAIADKMNVLHAAGTLSENDIATTMARMLELCRNY